MRVAEQKLRLCIVTPAHSMAQSGGAEYQIDCLLDVLMSMDCFQIHYLAHYVADDRRPDGYEVVPIGQRGGRLWLGFSTHALSLYRALRALDPDIIYQRVACGYTGVAAYYARRHGVRMVWHVAHDSDVMRTSRFHGRNPLRRMVEKSAIEYGIRHARQIVTQTAHQARLLESNYGRKVTAVIPNFQPAPTGGVVKAELVTVIWIANLKPWKQPEVFVRLAKALDSLKDVRFVMVGAPSSGSSDKPWHDRLIRDMNCTGNLDYVGQKTQEEVSALLDMAHIFVNTSEQEGFPNTFIQAWLREVPVVSLHVDPDGVLEREKIGVLAGTEQGLLDAVRSLATDASRRTDYGARARRYAMAAHSLNNAWQLGRLLESAGVLESPSSGQGEHIEGTS
jgi:glycosyltransferase involved in cell wall biosynthesis